MHSVLDCGCLSVSLLPVYAFKKDDSFLVVSEYHTSLAPLER